MVSMEYIKMMVEKMSRMVMKQLLAILMIALVWDIYLPLKTI